MLLILRLVLALLLMFWVFGQVRKPTGALGSRILRVMNRTHSTLTDWGLQYVPVERNATILDVGCGGGRMVQRLAALGPEAVVHGIDHGRDMDVLS